MPAKTAQLISLLGGHWGNIFLQTEWQSAPVRCWCLPAIPPLSAHTTFLSPLHGWNFFQRLCSAQQIARYSALFHRAGHRYSCRVLLLANGSLNILGDMYAFGLLGAFYPHMPGTGHRALSRTQGCSCQSVYQF